MLAAVQPGVPGDPAFHLLQSRDALTEEQERSARSHRPRSGARRAAARRDVQPRGGRLARRRRAHRGPGRRARRRGTQPRLRAADRRSRRAANARGGGSSPPRRPSFTSQKPSERLYDLSDVARAPRRSGRRRGACAPPSGRPPPAARPPGRDSARRGRPSRPRPSGRRSVSGGVRSSRPRQNGHWSSSSCVGGSISAWPAPGLLARPGAMATRRPETGSRLSVTSRRYRRLAGTA